MTPHRLAISIPTPCPAGWAAMTPTSNGRHCASCQKTVVNFSQQTDAEILAYFKLADRNGTCGRFRREQLSRPLVSGKPSAQRWQLWLASLVVAALTVQGCHAVTGEPTPVSVLAPQIITADSITVDSTAVEAEPYPTPLSGRVVDQYSQQPVAGVVVHLKNTSATIITDEQGLFAFAESATPVPATHSNPFVLQLRADGYPPCEATLDRFLPPPNQELQVVATWQPIPEYLMGDVETLRESSD